VLDTAPSIARAAQILGEADVSASSSINLVSYEEGVASAITVELHPGGPGFVLPDELGWLIHTNHFLDAAARPHDTEPKGFPDTLLRHNLLSRRLRRVTQPSADDILEAMASHAGGGVAICCHHDPSFDPAIQYETLATIVVDVKSGDLRVGAGGPCQDGFRLTQERVAHATA
jgi:isopenicillin-N N-acyltransferase-like protein